MSVSPEVEVLNEAVQKFANQMSDDPVMVTEAIVIWEAMSFDENGEPQRQVSYTVPTDNFSLTGALGLLEAGKHYVRRDILGEDDA